MRHRVRGSFCFTEFRSVPWSSVEFAFAKLRVHFVALCEILFH